MKTCYRNGCGALPTQNLCALFKIISPNTKELMEKTQIASFEEKSIDRL